MASSSMCVQQCHFTSNRSDSSIAAKSFCLLLTSLLGSVDSFEDVSTPQLHHLIEVKILWDYV